MPAGRLEGVSVAEDLYVTDFIGWTVQQARLLRAAASGTPDATPDWEHLAEEVESLGKSYRQALASRVGTVIEHLLQLENAPADELRADWLATIGRAREDMQSWLANEPGLRTRLPEIVAEQLPWTARLVTELLRAAGEPVEGVAAWLAGGGYTVEQITGDWLPPAP